MSALVRLMPFFGYPVARFFSSEPSVSAVLTDWRVRTEEPNNRTTERRNGGALGAL